MRQQLGTRRVLDIGYALIVGFPQLFTFDTFGLMSVGIFIGFLIGILPGMGGPTALALMLPFIVTMTPVQAFAFLLGMSSVTSTTVLAQNGLCEIASTSLPSARSLSAM